MVSITACHSYGMVTFKKSCIALISEYSSLSSFNPSRTKLILNADGVYITSYAALHLNMNLATLKAYSTVIESDLMQRQAIKTR